MGTSKTSEALMNKLEQMFINKNINKTLIQFSSLDSMNAMSGEKKDLQRCIRQISLYVLYINCQNHCLAICLVHLLEQYNKLESVEALLLSIWKIFHYSLIKQAVFENAQETQNMMPLKILISCTTQWLMHNETSICVITRFKPLVAALDSISTKIKRIQRLRVYATSYSLQTSFSCCFSLQKCWYQSKNSVNFFK